MLFYICTSIEPITISIWLISLKIRAKKREHSGSLVLERMESYSTICRLVALAKGNGAIEAVNSSSVFSIVVL